MTTNFVRGVIHQAREFGDFVVGGDASRTMQNTDAALREIGGEFGQDREHRFIVRIDAKDDFEFGIIQPAETGQVLRRRPGSSPRMGFRMLTGGVNERSGWIGGLSKIAPGAKDRDEVIDEWNGRNRKEHKSLKCGIFSGYSTPG